MPKKKTNPRRIHANMQDVQKAKEAATKDACRYAMAMVFMALRNSERFGQKRMKRVFDEVGYISEKLKKGHIRMDDILKELEEKSGIRIT